MREEAASTDFLTVSMADMTSELAEMEERAAVRTARASEGTAGAVMSGLSCSLFRSAASSACNSLSSVERASSSLLAF